MQWFLDWWKELGLVGQVMACAAIPTSLILLLQAILMLIGAGFGEDSDSFDGDGADTDVDIDVDADVDIDMDVDIDIDTDMDMDMELDADSFGADGAGVYGGSASGIDADADTGSGAHIPHHIGGGRISGPRMLTVRGVIAFFAIGGWAGLAALSAGIPAIWSVQISLLAGVAAMILSYFVIKFAMRMQSSGNIDLRNALAQTAEVYITIPPSRSNTGKVMMLLQERLIEIDAVTDDAEAIKPNTKVEVVGLSNDDCLVVRKAADGG